MRTRSLTVTLAFRWICLRQGIHLRSDRLQQGHLGSELCCLHCRCQCFSDRLRSSGCYQDPYPEPQLREPRVWLPNCVQHAQERGCHESVQGIDPQASDDWTQVGFQLLAGTDLDPCFRSGRIEDRYIRSDFLALAFFDDSPLFGSSSFLFFLVPLQIGISRPLKDLCIFSPHIHGLFSSDRAQCYKSKEFRKGIAAQIQLPKFHHIQITTKPALVLKLTRPTAYLRI